MRGHVKRRGKKWYAVVDIGRDDTGKRRQKTKTFSTKRAAEEWCATIAAEATRGDRASLLRGHISTADYLTEWVEGHALKNIRATTADNYRWLVKSHIVLLLGAIPLGDVRPSDVERLYNQKLAEGYSLATLHRIHGLLRMAFEHAVATERIARNPVLRKLRPKKEALGGGEHETEEVMRSMTEDQAKAFESVSAETRFHAANLLALRRGLRRGEILGLKWSDIDLDQKVLRVQRQLVRRTSEGIEFHPPKTRRGRRTVLLSDDLVVLLKKHRVRQMEERLKRAKTYEDHNLVFPTQDGKPFDPNRFVKRHYKPLLAAAKLPDFRFHDLRHTCATLMLLRGVDIQVVSRLLGHANVGFTLRVYGHLLPGVQEAALTRFDAGQ